MNIYLQHSRAITTYATMQQAVDFYDRVYNASLTDDVNIGFKLSTIADEVWGKRKEGNKTVERGNHAYFVELIEDIQGLKHTRPSGLDDIVGKLRTGMVGAGLGLNPKVWASQLSSYAASLPGMSLDSLMKGGAAVFGKGTLDLATAEGRERLRELGKTVDEYCPFARIRHEDNHAYMAQGVIEKNGELKARGTITDALGKAQEFSMAPIGWVDRAVVCALFEACKYETAVDGIELGSVENLKAAGEKLEELILDFQQNSIATEKSRAMRSDKEMVRILTMFSSDAMRTTSRLIDGFGEVASLKEQLKLDISDTRRKSLEAKLKKARLRALKSVVVVMSNAAYMSALSLLFRFLRGQLDDDDNVWALLTGEGIGGLFSGLPLLRDIISKITDGYDVTNSTFESLNSLLTTITSLYKRIGRLVTGEGEWGDVLKALRQFAFAASQILGLPVRNVWNQIYGFIKIIAPGVAEVIDEFFGD
jgi:hypothetical protein